MSEWLALYLDDDGLLLPGLLEGVVPVPDSVLYWQVVQMELGPRIAAVLDQAEGAAPVFLGAMGCLIGLGAA